ADVADAGGGLVTIVYNSIDEVTTKYDAINTTIESYDQRGLPTNSNTKAVNGQNSATTTYVYDALSHLTTITDPNSHTTSMSYDPLGRLRTHTSPVGGVETYTYDLAGQLISYTDP